MKMAFLCDLKRFLGFLQLLNPVLYPGDEKNCKNYKISHSRKLMVAVTIMCRLGGIGGIVLTLGGIANE